MNIIELLKNVASRDKSDHRFEISATNLVNYIEIEFLFKALLNIISTIFKFVVYGTSISAINMNTDLESAPKNQTRTVLTAFAKEENIDFVAQSVHPAQRLIIINSWK